MYKLGQCYKKLLVGLFILLLTTGCHPKAAASSVAGTEMYINEAAQGSNPTSDDAYTTARRQQLETLFAHACLEKNILSKYDEIVLRWPSNMSVSEEIAIRVMNGNRIYSERHATVQAGDVIKLGKAYVFLQGSYEVVIMPHPSAYELTAPGFERRIAIEIWPHQADPLQEATAC